MIKKTITYKDFNGKERTEDFYFHLTEAELVELEVSEGDGLKEYLEQMVEEVDRAEILRIFKKILGLSIGKKSRDGVTFDKTDEIKNRFMNSNAYSVLIMETLTTEGGKVTDFINGIMPDVKTDEQPVLKQV